MVLTHLPSVQLNLFWVCLIDIEYLNIFRKIYFSLLDYGVFRCDYDDCANGEQLYAQRRGSIRGMALDVTSKGLIYNHDQFPVFSLRIQQSLYFKLNER